MWKGGSQTESGAEKDTWSKRAHIGHGKGMERLILDEESRYKVGEAWISTVCCGKRHPMNTQGAAFCNEQVHG